MDNDSPNNPVSSRPVTAGGPIRPPGLGFWSRVQILAAALLCAAGIAVTIYLLRPDGVNGQSFGQPTQYTQAPASTGAEPNRNPLLFNGWSKPDLAIIVSGQMHGYLQKCGCSSPQFGGLTRRYNFIESLRAKGWQLVAVDVGELAQDQRTEAHVRALGPQKELKYEFAMKALKIMKYDAVGLGLTEFNMPLHRALGTYSLNNPTPPVLATNLLDPNQNFATLRSQKFAIVNVNPQLGFFSIVDPNVAKEVKDPDAKFSPAAKGLVDVMTNNRASVNIVLYQGTDSNAEVGKFITDLNNMRAANPKVPHVPIILCLGDPEPPARPKIIGTTTIITVGQKGRFVGVIGLFKNPAGPGFHLKYELVSIGEELDTPEGAIATHPLMNLLEEYTKIVEQKKFIDKFQRNPHPNQVAFKAMGLPTDYVGSDKCASCHKEAYNVWNPANKDPKFHYHSEAFETLKVKAKHPSRRQYDGECVVCHTVGFAHSEGYLDARNPAGLNALLEGVGCESCHGPGGAHIKDRTNTKVHELMNPYSTTKRLPQGPPAAVAAFVARQFGRQDDFCQKCHDQENDVHWSKVPYQQSWAKIQHYTRPAAAPGGVVVPPPNIGAIPPPPPPPVIDVKPEK